jgi:XapX domain-containing protein
MEIVLILKSLAVGIVVGLIFKAFNLPIPAPITIAGIAGIIGLYIGYKII